MNFSACAGRFVCLFFLCIVASQTIGAQTLTDTQFEARTEALVAKAKTLRLHEERFWLILLQYERSFGKYKSRITNADFFLAHDGRTNPEAELLADIRAFRSDETAAARFPARWQWIRERLAEYDEDFPDSADAAYQSEKKRAAPSRVILVFPAGFMQNPASMFGHTLLLFQNENKNWLLGQSVTYSARNTENPGIVFAIKGLFGLYKSNYVIEQYSKQILKYSDMDKRDIWEYPIKLSDYQVDMLFRHTLELASAESNYYYISQNCTTGLILLLETAFPNENLLDALGGTAEPVEAIKILWKKDLLDEPNFRPSLHTQILAERKQIGRTFSHAVKAYCKGKSDIETLLAMSEQTEVKAKALRLAIDYLKYLLSAGKITQAAYKARMMPALNAMSSLDSVAQEEITSTDYPHAGHDSHKIALSGGIDDGDAFAQVQFRFVNHSLIDDDRGLNKNTQLEFFTGTIGFYPNEEKNERKFRVENIYFTDILSLPVSDSYFFAKALSCTVGLKRTQISADSDSLACRIKFHSGISFKIFEPNQIYVLAGLDTFITPKVTHTIDILPGFEAGILTTVGIWKQQLRANLAQGIFLNQDDHWQSDIIDREAFIARERLRLALSVEERLTFSQNTALSATYTFSGDYKTYHHSAALTFHWHF